LSNKNQSFLRFSLEESIWFQKGQEVEELYSLSLDPNVTIQESDQFVVIKGTLDVSGEYQDEGKSGESELKDYTQSFFPRTIHTVEKREDGLNEFTHHFPVDITIPNYRVRSLDEIDIAISSFDYFLPENNCLKLQAELYITGIYGEMQAEEERPVLIDDTDIHQDVVEEDWIEQILAERNEQTNEETEAEEDVAELEEESELNNRQSEASLEKEEEDVAELEEEFELNDRQSEASPEKAEVEELEALELEKAEIEKFEEELEIEFEPYRLHDANPTEEVEEEYKLLPLYREKEEIVDGDVDDLYTPFTAEAKKIPILEKEIAPISAKELEPVHTFRSESKLEEEINDRPDEEDFHIEMEPEERPIIESIAERVVQKARQSAPLIELAQRKETEKTTRPSKNRGKASEEPEKTSSKERVSLMDFFGRNEEEELVKLKVCIVQHGETLDTLANRYEVPIQSLLNSNELEANQDIFEGQVLYIPKIEQVKN
jgi:stage VI sporulation protein D